MKWLGLGCIVLLFGSEALAQPSGPPPAGSAAQPDAGDWEQAPPAQESESQVQGAAPSAGSSEAPPGPYYTEPPAAGADRAAAPRPAPPPTRPAAAPPPPPPGAGIYEPPPPGMGPIYEPPPPPQPRHVAPKTALWVGGRLGWWNPFGALWANCTIPWADGTCAEISDQVPVRDVVRSGASFEGNLGIRFQRRYVLYAAWERAQLSGSGGEPLDPAGASMPRSTGGDTDFFGGGMRVTTDPDALGLLVDLTLGYRQMRARWDEGEIAVGQPHELRMTGALDFRMGLGADLRIGPAFSLTPLVSVGVGMFNKVEWVSPRADALGPDDVMRSHAWLSIALGGHFDIALEQ